MGLIDVWPSNLSNPGCCCLPQTITGDHCLAAKPKGQFPGGVGSVMGVDSRLQPRGRYSTAVEITRSVFLLALRDVSR